jgi:PAS domain S-box-containing protein
MGQAPLGVASSAGRTGITGAGEGLIVRLLADLVRARPDTIDGLIDRAMAELGSLAGANRAYVFQVRRGTRIDNSHEWVAPGTMPEIDNLQDLPLSTLEPCMPAFRQDRPVHVGDVATWDAGGALQALLLAQGIKAILLVPFWTEAGVTGFIGFDNTRTATPFDGAVVSLLSAAADVIGSTLHRLEVQAERERAQADLERSNQRLCRIFDALPDLIFELDPDGRFTDLALGPPDKMLVPLEERRGRSYRSILPAGLAEVIDRGLATARTGRISEAERYPLQQDGATVWHEMVVAPVGDPRAASSRYVLIVRDVTRDETARREREQTGLVARMMTNLVILTDAQGGVIWANPAFETRSGYRLSEMTGRSLLDFTRSPRSDPATEAMIAEAMAARRPCSAQILNATRDGEDYWVDVNVSYQEAGPSGEGIFVHVATDITEQKRGAEELARTKALLESAIEALPDAFAYYDAEDRLVMCNDRYREFYPRTADMMRSGVRFEDLIRHGVARGEYSDAIGREEEWIAERLARHRAPGAPLEQALSDGRWLQILERPTADGGRVGMRVDITALKRAEDRLAGIIEGAAVGTWEWVRGTDELRVNDRYARIAGYTLAEIDRRPIAAILAMIHEDDRARVEAAMRSLLQGESQSIALEFRLDRKDGQTVWVEVRGRVVSRSADGRPLRVAGMQIDISERKAAELALQRLNADLTEALAQRDAAERRFFDIASLSTDWFFETDAALCHIYLSDNFAKLAGLPTGAMLGRPLADLRDLSDAATAATAATAARGPDADPRTPWPELDAALAETATLASFIFEARARDGGARWLRLAMTPLRGADGALLGYRGVGTDVTELYRERALALQASEAKSRFLANMSHEIRTPLNGILGMAELLAPTLHDDRQREMISTVQSSGELLLSLLNNMLDMSKIEAGQLVLVAAPVRLDALGREADKVYGALARSKGVAFRLEEGPGLDHPRMGDVNRLRQILHNLLSNAVKFTSGGQVSLRLSAPPDAPVILEVADSGIGMTEAQQAIVFDPFQQAEAATAARYGGTGLGLSIVRDLVGLMGGEIAVESTPGAGTTFRLSLPLPPASRPEHAAAADEPAPAGRVPPGDALPRPPGPLAGSLSGRRLLAADDGATNLLVMRRMLEETGCTLLEAGNGREAVAAVEAAIAETGAPGFDLILLDISMPEMDGVEAITRIRAAEARAGRAACPAVAVTANAMAHQVADYIVAGFDGFLSKPFGKADLHAVIAPLLKAADRQPWSPSAPPEAAPRATLLPEPAPPDSAPRAAPAAAAGAALRRQALLAEDDPVMRSVLREVLGLAGFEVTACADTRAALVEAIARPFDLLVFDRRMPPVPGDRAIRALRSSATPNRAAPIVLVTAEVDHPVPGDAASCAPSLTLPKPLDAAALLAQLEALGLGP